MGPLAGCNILGPATIGKVMDQCGQPIDQSNGYFGDGEILYSERVGMSTSLCKILNHERTRLENLDGAGLQSVCTAVAVLQRGSSGRPSVADARALASGAGSKLPSAAECLKRLDAAQERFDSRTHPPYNLVRLFEEWG